MPPHMFNLSVPLLLTLAGLLTIERYKVAARD